MQFSLLVTLIFILFFSCEKKVVLNLKHTNREPVINCSGEKNELLNEVLYQFEEDITKAYEPEALITTTAYGRFLYSGFTGNAEYTRVASNHALEIRKALIVEGIIIDEGGKSNLNYKHPLMGCILSNMEDKDLAQTIGALIETNSMDPKLFNSRMRNFGRDAKSQRYTALYVALDTYYQQLTMTTLPSQEINE